MNIRNVSASIYALKIRDSANLTNLCTFDDSGDMHIQGYLQSSSTYITSSKGILMNVGTNLESLDSDMPTLEQKIAALAQALADAGILASAAFSSSLAYTLASTVVLGSSAHDVQGYEHFPSLSH